MTLCDTGPLVALIDKDDANHQRCVQALSELPPEPLTTTWPCLTEAMHLLHRAGGLTAQNELWGFLADGLVRLHIPAENEWRRLYELMVDYGDMPLDLADASLVSLAEQLGQRKLFSLDSQLRAVRIHGKDVFEILP